MVGLTNYAADYIANYMYRAAAVPSPPTLYAALFTAVGTDAGTGFTEVSGGGYSRPACTGDFGAAAGTAPALIVNSSGALVFGTASGVWSTAGSPVIGLGWYDAASGGNLWAWDFTGNCPWYPFTCTLASPGVITAPGITAGSTPTLVNGATVTVTGEYGGTLPTGLTQYAQLTVASLSADTFNVGVNTSSVGAGMVREVVPYVIPNLVGPVSLPTSSFTMSFN